MEKAGLGVAWRAKITQLSRAHGPMTPLGLPTPRRCKTQLTSFCPSCQSLGGCPPQSPCPAPRSGVQPSPRAAACSAGSLSAEAKCTLSHGPTERAHHSAPRSPDRASHPLPKSLQGPSLTRDDQSPCSCPPGYDTLFPASFCAKCPFVVPSLTSFRS